MTCLLADSSHLSTGLFHQGLCTALNPLEVLADLYRAGDSSDGQSLT